VGLLINIEGIDRSGKSSQIEPVSKALVEQGRTVSIMNFPDRPGKNAPVSIDLPIPQYATGALITRYLLGKLPLIDLRDSFFRRPEIAALDTEVKEAMAADIQEKIIQAIYSVNRRERAKDLHAEIEANDFVFVGRWLSGYTYGIANGVGRAQLDSIEGELPQPDLTILLDLDPEIAKGRRTDDVYDLYEANEDLQTRVRRLYSEHLAEEEKAAAAEGRPSRIISIDGSQPADDITAEIVALILSFEAARPEGAAG
jgi:thymidylate kinase